eukprot:TRINITY_DN19137_c0_g1_i2.p1 TRINITY_DN19137_c0_g1~~TRINITY_DN19137_c0_g1_i2.p1  ORF type:complete len:140 (-),score=29.80 TRINITY_DN19137_c0_g1_i2:13-432(-)
MIRRPPRSTQGVSSAASDVYKRQVHGVSIELIPDFPGSEYIHLRGPAERSCGTFATSWNKCYLLLTEADCLHVMESEGFKYPIVSFRLDETKKTLKSTKPNEIILSLHTPGKGFLSHACTEELRITDFVSEWETAFQFH